MGHSGLQSGSALPPRVGAWTALTVFGLLSWLSLVDDGTVGDHLWFCAAAGAGIQVSRWLARFGAERLTPLRHPENGWFDSGSALAVGFGLLLPGTACWLATRALLSARGPRAPRRSRAARYVCSASWIVWALAGAAGQFLVAWLTLANSGTALYQILSAALPAAGLLNAVSMSVLIWFESTPEPHRAESATVARHAPQT